VKLLGETEVVKPEQLSVEPPSTSPAEILAFPEASNCTVKSVHTATGSSVSLTVTSNEQVVVLPHSSVMLNELVVEPKGKVLPLGRPPDWVTVTDPQLSDPPTVYDTTAPHIPASLPTVMLEGQLAIGDVVSTIVMVCVQVDEFPQSSVAVHVLVMVSVFPQPAAELSENVIVAVPQPSVPVAVPVLAGEVSPPHSTVVLAGQLIDGGVASTTVMVCVQLNEFPQSSVAVHVLVMVSVFPQPAAELSENVIVAVPQPSVPVAVPVLAGEVSPPHSTVVSDGQVIVGGVVSSTVIV
jgi:hypothetical protein